jgi:hypothetical protein
MAQSQESSLAEELTIMKAIYAEDLEITSQSPTNTGISIRLESQPFAFILSIPATYPQQAPQFQGTEPLWVPDPAITRKGKKAFNEWLTKRFTAGEPCLFNLLEDVRGVLRSELVSEDPDGNILPPLPESETLHPRLVDVAGVQDSGTCNARLDTLFLADLARLQCKHLYCRECLQREYFASY